MALPLKDWLKTLPDYDLAYLSQVHFHRDPARPTYSDLNYFFSPADGIILYQTTEPDIEIKGQNYSLSHAVGGLISGPALIIGIFMTFYDVHINRIPYPGRLSYVELESIRTNNYPMLAVEKEIMREVVSLNSANYLFFNQRVLNKVYGDIPYFILQIADYDVDCILHFENSQNLPVFQGQRFSIIRYGSQVDLVIPLRSDCNFNLRASVGDHVEAGVDTLVELC